jgi:23S rRNA C2498 (ribose-2'-O)-methylase RlmM
MIPFGPKNVAKTWSGPETTVQTPTPTSHLFLCRAGYETALAEEWSIARSGSLSVPQNAPLAEPDSGIVRVGASTTLPENPFIFERQRMPAATWHSGDDLAALAASVAAMHAKELSRGSPWTVHSYAPNPDTEDSRSREAQALERRLLTHLQGANPTLLENFRAAETQIASRDTQVWQLCRIGGGAWSSIALGAELSDPFPGGVHRMPSDPLAPSRSYLKIEEALDVMRQGGIGGSPHPSEKVVDLGAAPGGWTWAFVKRGCRVYAVDNGPLKLQSTGDMGGEAIHLREDGLRYRPPRPVDWLLSDMLIAPGQALGLLRRWLDEGLARRLIVNIKLPQADPLVALAPIRNYLREVPGLRFALRQLYHDRREVTLMGELKGGARISKPQRPDPKSPATRSKHGGPRAAPRPSRRGRGRP